MSEPSTEDLIRDLAKTQGVDNLDDVQVHDIKDKLSVSYIDDVLDGKLDTPEAPSVKREST